jgi:uncharacterized caspase-like protein
VCVGIADYPGTSHDLHVSATDAVTIKNDFNKSNAYATALTNNQATWRNVCTEMLTVFENAQKDDVVILYFSGHGVPGGLVCYDGILTYDAVFGIMKNCIAQNKVILVDACFAGKMRKTNRQTLKYRNKNIMLFLSSRSTETSLETRYKNSLFTIFLDRGLRGGADVDRNRIITARELFNYVHPGVINWSKNRQHPVMWGNFNDNMPIIKW